MRRRLIVTVVSLVLIAAAAVFALRPGRSWHTSIRVATPTSSSTTLPTTSSSSTSTTTTTVPPEPNLAEGATGPEVVALQQRLVDLGYWLGAVNGNFDDSTAHAVVAFQKSHELERDGIVGPLTRTVLATATRVAPRSTSGHVFEIDLSRQLLLDVWDGHVRWVFDTATGAVAGTTPVGLFRISWQIDGWVHSHLGVLYRPKYFYDGVAIHGNPSVPPVPASHGCVRVVNGAMDWIWANNEMPIGTPVAVY